jgi:hypothetical protein
MRNACSLVFVLLTLGCDSGPEIDPRARLKEPGGAPGEESYEVSKSGAEMPALTAPPELLATTEDGFADLIFFVSRFESTAEAFVVEARAVYGGDPVGLRIDLPRTWKALRADEEPRSIVLYDGSIVLRPLPEVSGPLVSAVRAAYALPPGLARFASEVHGLAVSLQGDPSKIESEVCQIKAFFGDGESENDPYAEVFFAIDLKRKALRIEEKDITYRMDLVRFLAGDAPTSYRDPADEPTTVIRTEPPVP